MNGTALLADHLGSRTDAIIALWRSTVESQGDVPKAGRLSDEEFVDHIPEILDRLVERLRGRSSDAGAEGRKHGRLRWRQGYGVSEIVIELEHLRTSLGRATFDYARRHKFDLASLESALRAIDELLGDATAEAVAHFHAIDVEQTRRAVEEAEERQAAVEAERIKLRTVLEHLPVGVWVVDAEGAVLAANREAERLQGRPESAVVGLEDVDRPAPGLRLTRPDGSACEPGELPLARALRGEAVSQEVLAWWQGDRRRVVAVNAAPFYDGQGAIRGAVAVAQDVTERDEAERKLLAQLDFTRTLTQSLGEGVVALDRDGRVTFVNPAALEMFGLAEAELIGADLHRAVHGRRPDGSPYPAEECPMLGVLRTGQIARGDEVLLRKGGAMFPVAYTTSPIVSSGRIAGIVQVLRDITASKRMEADLAASEARFRVIAEQSPVMIWRAGADGRFDYVNRTWSEFRGRSVEQELGEGRITGIHPDDLAAYRDAFEAALARREPFQVDYRLLRHDGQYRWIADRGAPYYDAAGTFLGYLGSCLDITPRIELERALEQQRELAEESSEHKTRLMSALSHDARTPLNAVVLAAQLLEMHIRADADPEVAECLRTIRHSVGNVLDLLGDLLNLTRIDAGAVAVEPSRFPLEPVLAESLSSVEPQARVKGLDVRLEPGDLAGSVLETDRAKVKQVLCNLLSNALRYTERGHIRVYAERGDDQVRLAVEDTGIGIDPADHQRVFDEFATLSGSRRQAGEGTGLGLAICRRLANLLKGEITLDSAPGRGSTFSLVLPASVLTTAAPSTNGPPSAEAPSSGVILIAEDHLASRQTLAKVLRRMGYRVLEAGNGRDALALIARERPLAVLMDINMPIMDGIEATLELRADPRYRDLPIFALTGDVSVINQRRIGEAGVNGYLEKPVTWDILKQALASLRPGP